MGRTHWGVTYQASVIGRHQFDSLRSYSSGKKICTELNELIA